MLQCRKMNFLVDGQFGSTGKGLISTFLAREYNVVDVACSNMPNSGHTAVNELGEAWISKALPTCAILHRWYNQDIRLWLSPTAGFTLGQLNKELEGSGLAGTNKVNIHPRVGIVTKRHAEIETGNNGKSGSTKHLASTMQGSGSMLAEKICRGQGVELARDYPELSEYMCVDWFKELNAALQLDRPFLYEGCQGFSLGINHGHSYPTCTSRECTSMQAAADMGINAGQIGEIIQVIRPYPIRVGNVYEGNKEVGNSGGWYSDQEETSFEKIGAPVELTTVTKRPRRIATFSWIELEKSVRVNGTTQIALNFINQIDKNCYGTNKESDLNSEARAWIDDIENHVNMPVSLVGTGPQINHVIMR